MRASDTFRHHAKMTSQLHPLWGQLPEGFTFLVGQAVSPARSFSDSEVAGETACPTKTARQSFPSNGGTAGQGSRHFPRQPPQEPAGPERIRTGSAGSAR